MQKMSDLHAVLHSCDRCILHIVIWMLKITDNLFYVCDGAYVKSYILYTWTCKEVSKIGTNWVLPPAKYKQNNCDESAGSQETKKVFYISTHRSQTGWGGKKPKIVQYTVCGEFRLAWVCVHLKEIIFFSPCDFMAYIKTSTYLNQYCWSMKE